MGSTLPRLHLRISPTAEWKLRSGHPWLYDQSIASQSRPAEAGELAVIYDRHDNFLAIGLFDPGSPIRVRILHKGKPQILDDTWWRQRLQDSIQRRQGLFDQNTTGYRWIHGESDGWPGLVLDRYGATLVLKLYTAAWLPHLPKIAQLILSQLAPDCLVLRLSRNIQGTAKKSGLEDGQVLHGPAPEGPVVFLETGLKLEADVIRGQKTGFFLDQRENRRTVESMASGRKVLNVFSFSGGFSLYAARGGARGVTDLDISAHALESAKRNFALNQNIPSLSSCDHKTIQADGFEWLEKHATPAYDMVILDPPSLAKREAEGERAVQAYGKLSRLGIASLRRNGVLVTASCSAHVTASDFYASVRETAVQSGRRFEELSTTGQPPDHPATFPEALYLKCIYLRFA